MKRKSGMIVLVFLIIVSLWLAVNAGAALAEMGFGGKVETNILSKISPEGEISTSWQEHLKLEFLLPELEDTSAKFEVHVYYEPQSTSGKPKFSGDVSKLYLKHKFEQMYLTIGRQPINWSFGSLINPVDFSVSTNLLKMGETGLSENALLGYIPLNLRSNLTLVAAFPEMSDGLKLGIRGRTQLLGFDLTASYLREPERLIEQIGFKLPISQRYAFTAKGDLGPVGVYGVIGYYFGENLTEGKKVYLGGSDYSFSLANGCKIIAQVEYLHDEAAKVQSVSAGPNLILGTFGYEIDEFSGISLLGAVNPKDKSYVIVPVYKNQIGAGLDFSFQGGIFFGAVGTQFGPQELIPGYIIPRVMVQVGAGYQF